MIFGPSYLSSTSLDADPSRFINEFLEPSLERPPWTIGEAPEPYSWFLPALINAGFKWFIYCAGSFLTIADPPEFGSGPITNFFFVIFIGFENYFTPVILLWPGWGGGVLEGFDYGGTFSLNWGGEDPSSWILISLGAWSLSSSMIPSSILLGV